MANVFTIEIYPPAQAKEPIGPVVESFGYDPESLKTAEAFHIVKREALLTIVGSLLLNPENSEQLLGYSLKPPILPEQVRRIAIDLETSGRVRFINS